MGSMVLLIAGLIRRLRTVLDEAPIHLANGWR